LIPENDRGLKVYCLYLKIDEHRYCAALTDLKMKCSNKSYLQASCPTEWIMQQSRQLKRLHHVIPDKRLQFTFTSKNNGHILVFRQPFNGAIIVKTGCTSWDKNT